MKSGFLISDNPKISLLSEKPKEIDESIGTRKYICSDFDFERNIGSGNFSNVWHVTLKSDPFISYALKIYNISLVNSKNHQNFVKQERSSLLCLNSPGHKNVIKLIDTFKDDSNVYLIYEHATDGELWDLIKYSGSICDEFACWIIHQVIDGLEYIHSKGIIHRDLKCENIVISQNTLKIIDFATSQFYNTINTTQHKSHESTLENTLTHENTLENTHKNTLENTHNNTLENTHNSTQRNKLVCGSRRFEYYVGTPNFMDPETISNTDSGFKRDFWSLGCLIYQILVGRPPFYGSTEYFVIDRVKKLDITFPPCINPDAKDLILSLLKEPEERLGFDQIRNHPFLTSNKPRNLLGEFKSIRETCWKIGKLLLELARNRTSELSQEFTQKFNTLIETLSNEVLTEKEEFTSKCILKRVIELMYWMLQETRNEIIKEVKEADKYLS